MLPVKVNARFLLQVPTGVQRYAFEILRRWPSVELIAPGIPLNFYREAIGRHVLKRTWGFSFSVLGHIWEQAVLPWFCQGGVLWSPGGSGPLAHPRQVVTVHDIAHIEHPEWYGKAFTQYYAWLLPRLLRRVARVITVSDFSRLRILDIFGIDEDKVVVTPLGVDRRFSPRGKEEVRQVREIYRLEKPYVLSVSAVSERKNLVRLLLAWKSLSFSDIELVMVGPQGLAFSGGHKMPEEIWSIPGVRYLGYVPDDHLPALYSGALAFAYVSLYEGFGLPVLEAMACGAAVVTSNITALPGLVGDAALLVNPYDVEAIADGIWRAVQDSNLREQLRSKGLERSKMYDWGKTAENTMKLLREVGSE